MCADEVFFANLQTKSVPGTRLPFREKRVRDAAQWLFSRKSRNPQQSRTPVRLFRLIFKSSCSIYAVQILSRQISSPTGAALQCTRFSHCWVNDGTDPVPGLVSTTIAQAYPPVDNKSSKPAQKTTCFGYDLFTQGGQLKGQNDKDESLVHIQAAIQLIQKQGHNPIGRLQIACLTA